FALGVPEPQSTCHAAKEAKSASNRLGSKRLGFVARDADRLARRRVSGTVWRNGNRRPEGRCPEGWVQRSATRRRQKKGSPTSEKNEPRSCQLYWVTAASNKAGARSGS